MGFQIRNVDSGTNQKRKLTFSSAMSSGQQFSVGISFNGKYAQITPVVYATSWAATQNAIISALQFALASLYATGWEVVALNNFEIAITAPVDGADKFSFSDPKVTLTSNGNSTGVTVTDSQMVSGVDAEDAFDLRPGRFS